MRVLFDVGTPRGIKRALSDHICQEARDLGWDSLKNGELLNAAENQGFDVFLTTDKNILYQQNLTGRKIAIVVLGRGRWRLIQAVLPQVTRAIDEVGPGGYCEVDIPG